MQDSNACVLVRTALGSLINWRDPPAKYAHRDLGDMDEWMASGDGLQIHAVSVTYFPLTNSY